MNFVILIWLILPALLLFLTIWSYIKTNMLKGEKEQVGMYFKQFLFTSFAFLVSVTILVSSVVIFVSERLLFNYISPSFLEFFIYPIVLIILAVLSEKRGA